MPRIERDAWSVEYFNIKPKHFAARIEEIRAREFFAAHFGKCRPVGVEQVGEFGPGLTPDCR